MKYKPPFPWFGGKAPVADVVWSRFGPVDNYVEPFFGSGAVLFLNPYGRAKYETVNDADGFLVNLWRAVQNAPEEVARWACNPVFECDLHARHSWLVNRRTELVERLEGDPDYYDAKIAGWWVWGACLWIGSGWCAGEGRWVVVDGRLVNRNEAGVEADCDGVDRKRPQLSRGLGVNRQIPLLSHSMGVQRRRPHLASRIGVERRKPALSDAVGVNRKIPLLTDAVGVNRQRPHLSNRVGVNSVGVGQQRLADLVEYFREIADRLADVRVCCGNWDRVLGPNVTTRLGLTAVFLDPPYAVDAGRDGDIYAVDAHGLSSQVREWAIENGQNPLMRIALCGYEGEHDMPDDWESYAWSTQGGYANQGNGRGRDNKHRERIWFSPHCLKPSRTVLPLFEGLSDVWED